MKVENEDVSSQHCGVLSNPSELPLSTSQHCGLGTSNIEKLTEETPVREKLEDPGTNNFPSKVTVCMLKSVSKFTVPMQVDGVAVEAVLDSAAEVTIISDKIYESLLTPPKKLYDVRLDTAGRQLSMNGFVAGPVKLQIGQSTYEGPVYVAPIEQDMLFGLDIMRKGSAIIDMGRGVFQFKGHQIKMNSGGPRTGNPEVARVSVVKRMVIPPNSAAQVPCKMDHPMTDYVIELEKTGKVNGPRVVRAAGADPVVCIVNCSDRYKLLKKDKEIALATPIEEFLSEDEDEEITPPTKANVCEVSEANGTEQTDNTTVPPHLQQFRHI